MEKSQTGTVVVRGEITERERVVALALCVQENPARTRAGDAFTLVGFELGCDSGDTATGWVLAGTQQSFSFYPPVP